MGERSDALLRHPEGIIIPQPIIDELRLNPFWPILVWSDSELRRRVRRVLGSLLDTNFPMQAFQVDLEINRENKIISTSFELSLGRIFVVRAKYHDIVVENSYVPTELPDGLRDLSLHKRIFAQPNPFFPFIPSVRQYIEDLVNVRGGTVPSR